MNSWKFEWNVYPFSISQGTFKTSTRFINSSQQPFPTKPNAWQSVTDVDRVLFAAEVLEICAGVINVFHLSAVPVNFTSQYLHNDHLSQQQNQQTWAAVQHEKSIFWQLQSKETGEFVCYIRWSWQNLVKIFSKNSEPTVCWGTTRTKHANKDIRKQSISRTLSIELCQKIKPR